MFAYGLLGLVGRVSGARVSHVRSCEWAPVSTDTPFIAAGQGWDVAMWNDPSKIVRINDKVVFFATANNAFTGPVEVYRWEAPSMAGPWSLTQTAAVLSPASPFTGVETPDVVLDTRTGTLHMFITTYVLPIGHANHAFNFTVGYTTSTDGGLTFGPVQSELTAPTGNAADWNGHIVGEPGALLMPDGELRVYFTGIGVGPTSTLQTIGLMRSTDSGVTWGQPEQVMSPSPTHYPPAAGWYGFSTPCPALHPYTGDVHLFTDVVTTTDAAYPTDTYLQQGLTHASSPTGNAGTFVQNAAPIATNLNFTWTRREMRSPAPTFDVHPVTGAMTLYLFYAGDAVYTVGPAPAHARTYDISKFGIGLMTCELLAANSTNTTSAPTAAPTTTGGTTTTPTAAATSGATVTGVATAAVATAGLVLATLA